MLEQSVTTARDKSPIILYFTILFSNIGALILEYPTVLRAQKCCQSK